jgi:hypothetical protein
MNEKNVFIVGTNNKYQIKKLKKEPIEIKVRKIIKKIEIPDEYFLENQQNIINNLFVEQSIEQSIDKNIDQYKNKIISQLEYKLNGYKQQDNKKKIHNFLFITITDIIHKMYECKLDCYYCKEKVLILYKNVREQNQWTLDRINNDLGHTNENTIISCLKCNLKRRRTGKDAFLFTKQLNIIKLE